MTAGKENNKRAVNVSAVGQECREFGTLTISYPGRVRGDVSCRNSVQSLQQDLGSRKRGLVRTDRSSLKSHALTDRAQLTSRQATPP